MLLPSCSSSSPLSLSLSRAVPLFSQQSHLFYTKCLTTSQRTAPGLRWMSSKTATHLRLLGNEILLRFEYMRLLVSPSLDHLFTFVPNLGTLISSQQCVPKLRCDTYTHHTSHFQPIPWSSPITKESERPCHLPSRPFLTAQSAAEPLPASILISRQPKARVSPSLSAGGQTRRAREVPAMLRLKSESLMEGPC